MKTLFEQYGGTYTMQGDYHLPNLTVEETETRPIGVWGQRRLRYLKHHRKVLYYNLLTSGKLHSHLVDTEEQAQELFNRLITDLAAKEGITEQLKATDQMKWIQRMNSIRERLTETIYSDVVCIIHNLTDTSQYAVFSDKTGAWVEQGKKLQGEK